MGDKSFLPFSALTLYHSQLEISLWYTGIVYEGFISLTSLHRLNWVSGVILIILRWFLDWVSSVHHEQNTSVAQINFSGGCTTM